ncbi:antibiotic biosynthesis monooxygenase family protein [Nocardia sp. CA-107356]|uniref:antibiotic biosynthesis monooxygenase family protein n=1 Tax=Nocardia sp. CA-107356 TaxID=3239972 RepID=UPI003D9149B9
MNLDGSARVMIAVANCIAGPSSFASWIKESFAATFSTLDEVPGVREFHLRRLTASGEHCLLVSITIWDDIEHFEWWRTSAAFVAAHPDRKAYQSEFRRMRSIRYDIATVPATTIDDLDAEVVRRLSAEHPDLVSTDSKFVNEIHWTSAEVDRPLR